MLLSVSRVRRSGAGVAGFLPEQTLIRARASSCAWAVQRAPCFQLTADCNEAPDRLEAHRAVCVCIDADSGGVSG